MDGELEVRLDGMKTEIRRANHLLECVLETLLSAHLRTCGEERHAELERRLGALDRFDNASRREGPW